MKKSFVKKSLFGFMLLPALALTGCASDNQFGTVAGIRYTVNSGTIENTDSTQVFTTGDGFSGISGSTYGFNNFSTSATYTNSSADAFPINSGWTTYDSISTGAAALNALLVSEGSNVWIVDYLVNGAINQFRADNQYPDTSKMNSHIFVNSSGSYIDETDNSNGFREFLFAAANQLNIGDQDGTYGSNRPIRFGITGVELTFSSTSSASLEPVVNDKAIVVGEGVLAVPKDINVTFTYTYSYWFNNINEVTTNKASLSDVQNYVREQNLWSNFNSDGSEYVPQYSSFTIELNLQARLASVYSLNSSYWTGSSNSTTTSYDTLFATDANGNYNYGTGTEGYTLGSGDLDSTTTDADGNSVTKSTFSGFYIQYGSVTNQSTNSTPSGFRDLSNSSDFSSSTLTSFASSADAMSNIYSDLGTIFTTASTVGGEGLFSNYYGALTFVGGN